MAVPPTAFSMSQAVTKAALRRELRARRAAFVRDPGAMQSAFVAGLFVAERVRPHLAGARVVAAYISDGEEVDPMAILLQAIDRGVATALPRIAAKGEVLDFRHWLPGDPLVPGPLGLMQPAEDAAPLAPDLILAPLVGFDRALGRLGQGGGYYDRSFAALPAARRIGLAWSMQEVAAIPREAWDLPLHAVATEREWIAAA